jgi:hypothetical protein
MFQSINKISPQPPYWLATPAFYIGPFNMALGVFGEIRPLPVRQFHPLIHLSCPLKYLAHKCYSEVLMAEASAHHSK